MSKILKFGKKKSNNPTPETRLENTMKLLRKLIVEGVISREEEKEIVKMMNNKRTILGCPDKTLIKAYVSSCDGQTGKCKKTEYNHIAALGNFIHDDEEMQEIFDLEKLFLKELYTNLNGRECIIKDMDNNILKSGVIGLLFSADGEQMVYRIRMHLNDEILSEMRLEELAYVTDDYENYELQILNGDFHFTIEREEAIKTEECAIYFDCLEKRMDFMNKRMTPEQKEEMDKMMTDCLSEIVETETGTKPEILKEGEHIKITVEKPIIH